MKTNGLTMKKPSPSRKKFTLNLKISSVSHRVLKISTTLNYISPVYPKFNNSLKKEQMKSPWTPISLRKLKKQSRKISPWHITELKSNLKLKNLP
jgi:hypothetical protein